MAGVGHVGQNPQLIYGDGSAFDGHREEVYEQLTANQPAGPVPFPKSREEPMGFPDEPHDDGYLDMTPQVGPQLRDDYTFDPINFGWNTPPPPKKKEPTSDTIFPRSWQLLTVCLSITALAIVLSVITGAANRQFSVSCKFL